MSPRVSAEPTKRSSRRGKMPGELGSASSRAVPSACERSRCWCRKPVIGRHDDEINDDGNETRLTSITMELRSELSEKNADVFGNSKLRPGIVRRSEKSQELSELSITVYEYKLYVNLTNNLWILCRLSLICKSLPDNVEFQVLPVTKC